jgi:hypothetical protein
MKQENAMIAHVKELTASRKCRGNSRLVVTIGGSSHKGTEMYWCDPLGQWIIIALEASPKLAVAADIALIRLYEDADPDAIARWALACDFEDLMPLFVLDAARLGQLPSYGSLFEVLWTSAAEAPRVQLARAS